MANIEIKGMDSFISKLEKLGANVVEEQKKAVKEVQDYVTSKLRPISEKHIATGRMNASIYTGTPRVTTSGVYGMAGFNFDKGGWKSRFFLAEQMNGTPNKQKDQAMWDLFYSQTEKDKRDSIMHEHFKKAVENFGR